MISRTHTEGLANKKLDAQTGKHTWKGQNLQHSSEDTKYNFRIYYKVYTASGYGAEQFQFFDKQNKTCKDGGGYTFNVQ